MFPVPKCLCTVPIKMFSYVPCSQMSLHCSPQNVFLCSLFPNVLMHCSPQNVFECSLFPNVFVLFPLCSLFPNVFTHPLKMFSYVPCSQMSLHCSLKIYFFRGTVQRHLGTGNKRNHFVTRPNFGLSSLLLKLNVLVSLSPKTLWRASPVSGL